MRNVKKYLALGLVAMSASLVAEANVRQIFPTRQEQLWIEFNALTAPVARTKLQYFGGPVISNVEAHAVIWGEGVDAEVAGGIGGMLAATVDSTYMDMLAQYSTNLAAVGGEAGTNQMIGRGKYTGTTKISPVSTGALIDDAQIGAEIERQIEAGSLPKPSANTLLFLYFPAGLQISIDGAKSCETFCGYHSSVQTKHYGPVYYSVQPDISGTCSQGCGFGRTLFESISIVTSHELTEAITDPAVTPTSELAPPVAWVTPRGEEIGDVCASQLTTVTTPAGMQYRLQQAFDNSIEACNRGPFFSR